NFATRAKEFKSNIVVGGSNYGQGSSREHAALVPLYLGVKAVIAKSFARIHTDNLINAGILPLTFANPDDYDKLNQDDTLVLENLYEGMKNGKIVLKVRDMEIPLEYNYTDRQTEIIKKGGLLAYTKGE
ncbi:MAG: aconitate hydratase, partial [Clostridia bacterium]|nr:aconitate hydratase [Clostridia bacterium]